jgi:uncharacterized hydrophobic protein (TIGR00271 family)
MTIAIVLEAESQIGPDLRWPLRIAAVKGGEAVLLVPAPERTQSSSEEIPLSISEEQSEPAGDLATALRRALDVYVGEGRWTDRKIEGAEEEAAEKPRGEEPPPLEVRLRIVPRAKLVSETLELVDEPGTDVLLFVTEEIQGADTDWGTMSRAFLTRAACQAVYVLPGQRPGDGDLVATATRATHDRAAIQLAVALAEREERRLTGLYVEPDIGPDAPNVGRRILDRVLERAVGEKAGEVRRRVEVDNNQAKAILRACQDESYEVLLMGASRLGALGQRGGSIPYKVTRGTNQPTRIHVRATVPRRNRAWRWLEFQLQRRIPQLQRQDRTDLVERIQSNSQWNFDFILLMALSTVIASLGLLDNSAAVIIGAMLVAPLMTPLLGLGLAISQGNPKLARMTLKTVTLGFLVAFGLAVAVGVLSGQFHQSTPEMDARDWPQMLDLGVAFVAGLAAAYASGRPGLLAALPGVAIAAALLPPIATSGLALSIRNFDLAMGAALLFAVNVVGIILASAIALWAVGIHYARKQTTTARFVGGALAITAIVGVLALALAPPRMAPPPALVKAVEEKLDEETRLRAIHLKRESSGMVVQINLGGTRAPDAKLRAELGELAQQHLGESAGVRLTYRYEVLIR